MIVYPNAKINLGLDITNKRSDGYHDIETLFYPIALSDGLEVVFPQNCDAPYVWEASGNAVDCPPEKNLCIKALMKLREVRDIPAVGLHLHKVVPTGAGLGGGSSDAAFVISTICNLLKLDLSVEEQKRMAAGIGADCAFFIDNRPAFASGIGDVLTPADLDLSNWWILLVKPDVSVPTKTAYSKVRPQKPLTSITEIVKRPVAEWRGLLKNDFEESVFAEYPVVGEIKDELYRRGAVYASMSGSGSSVFGLFEAEPAMSGFAEEFFVWKGKMM